MNIDHQRPLYVSSSEDDFNNIRIVTKMTVRKTSTKMLIYLPGLQIQLVCAPFSLRNKVDFWLQLVVNL